MLRRGKNQTTKIIVKQVGKGLTLFILALIETLEHATTEAIMDHYHRGYPKVDHKAKIRSALRRLEKEKMIRFNKERGQNCYQLNLSGKTRLLAKQVFTNKTKATDGLSTVIIFDIPENKRAVRRYFRKLLVRNGFINLQKSVLIGPYDLPYIFFDMLTELNIRQNVTMLKSKVINL